jgi:hypothetical protein
MSNTTLTADVIAKAALPILENELGWLSTLYRAHESEYAETVNGYKKGATVSIRRPADFTIRSGAVMNTQDVTEGKVTLTVDQQKGVDFQFTSTELTLSMNKLAERVIKPAMVRLVNEVAKDVAQQMYLGTYNWAGTPGQTINSFADFTKGPERLDLMAVPQDSRHALLSPQDFWALVGSNTALFAPGVVESALRKGKLGMLGNVDTWMSQVTPTHTNGTSDNTTPVVKGSSQEVTYATAKDTWTQSLITDGWDSSTTITAGTVFTISGVYMVNPQTKAATDVLQEFVVMSTVTADETTSNATTLTISPPIITSGPHQTVTYSGDMDDNTITVHGGATASQSYRQNMIYHKNAMALAVVPMELPAGSAQVSRQTQNGLSVRVEAVRDGINDINAWRLDILYGRRLIDPRVIARLSGTS